MKHAIVVIISIMLLAPVFAQEKIIYAGFEGISWKKVIPVKKATFVKFDENSFLDDFAYLASIPASVFYDKETDKIYSYPLLFYQDYSKEKYLNARQGLDYFMEDWIKYCGKLSIDYINIEQEPWKGDNVSHINSDDIYEIASKIALHEWSYSNDLVLAIVGEYGYESNKTIEQISGKFSPKEIKKINLEGIKQDSLAPQYSSFYVPEGYKYLEASLWWPCVSWLPNFMALLTIGLLQGGLTIPSADPDLQLYCSYEGEFMQVAASETWNVMWGPHEDTSTYVYSSGMWKAAITDIPTKKILRDAYGTFFQRLIATITGKVPYYVEISLYPGQEVELIEAPFMARNVTFELSGNTKLGLIIVDENNVAIAYSSSNDTKQTLKIDQLGEGKYKAIIVQMNETDKEISYTLKYSWENKMNKSVACYMANAAEGAILASLMNAPLLYTKANEISSCTLDAIKKLGVRNIYLVNTGNEIAAIKTSLRFANIYEFNSLEGIYNEIKNRTKSDDIVISTLDPWTYMATDELKPSGELQGALFIGPAAYAAAHHGCPLLITDMHEELSMAVVWHNEWWKKHAIRDEEPNVAAMYLTAKQAYDFFGKMGFDKPGKIEYMLTVADQFDIGTPWDRAFVGVAYPGRIFGSPVDTSYWICRSVFYPAIIFTNPALNSEGIMLINGSESRRKANGLLEIIKPSQEEKFVYPVLNSWITYAHRFNERASQFWGCNYTCASGITPFYEPSTHPIDNNVLAKYGKYGSYWPDLTESEVVPFYLYKAGYSVAFTTNFSATMENLNRGVIMWLEATHGWPADGGVISFWNPYGMPGFIGINISLPTIEENPWRGYEIYLPGYLDGSTEEPDVLSQSKLLAIDIVPAKISDIPIIKNTFFGKKAGYDGNIITVIFGRVRTTDYTGYDIDNALKNIHSCGFVAGSCLISNTYLHLTLMRHGSVFQVIDPWETSWYSAFAFEMFSRDIALGKNVGEAFSNSILHTGIGYLTKQWWWDIKENLCYFGDPKLKVWSPNYRWEKPQAFEGENVEGHFFYGAKDYPNEIIEGKYGIYVLIFIAIVVIAGAIYARQKMKKIK
ncbi:MAG: hypothetical protein QXE46_05305 [Candidatus Thermoplasmatota archaeon]